MDTSSEGTGFTVVQSSIWRSNLGATVARDAFPGWRLPCLGTAITAGRSTSLWLYADGQGYLLSGEAALTTRAQQELGIGIGGEIVLKPEPALSLAAWLPSALDLPPGASVYAAPEVSRFFSSRGRRRVYALLTAPAGPAIPVRLYRRDSDGGKPLPANVALVSSAVRALCGLDLSTSGGESIPDEIELPGQIQLTRIPAIALRERVSRIIRPAQGRQPSGWWPGLPGATAGALRLAGRLLDFLVEIMLRAALRAQSLPFRVAPASLGDDDLRDTIRLHPSAFDALGVRPGGQVILNWAGQHLAVRVLATAGADAAPPAAAGPMDSDARPYPAGLPRQLVAFIPAQVRRTLNIPPDTSIEMRRRLRPAVVSQLNQLTIPVAGLIVAAAAVPSVRGWPLVGGAIAVAVLGLASLRIPRPPRGQWPA